MNLYDLGFLILITYGIPNTHAKNCMRIRDDVGKNPYK